MTNLTAALRSLPSRTASLRTTWWWNDLLVPFFITRLVWILAAYYASANFQPNPTYADYAKRGYFLSKYFLIDIFSRWDARHYLSIARDGYIFSGSLGQNMDNIAFFPLYPYLVKGLTWLAYGWIGQKTPDSLYLLTGILLSNLLFLGGSFLLYYVAVNQLRIRESTARRAIGWLMVFPVAFIFSSFYTESLFFFLSIAAFAAASSNRWMWAGLCAGLLTLTRLQGLIVVFMLGLLYMQQHEWKFKNIRPDALWLGLSPLLLASHLYNMYRLTGSFFAPFLSHEAWGRGHYGLLEGLKLQLEAPYLDVFKLDAVFILLFLASGIYMVWKWPNKPLGIYTLLMVIIPITTGMLISAQRFMLVIFPVFLLAGEVLQSDRVNDLLRASFFTLQVVYFIGWVNYYWIA